MAPIRAIKGEVRLMSSIWRRFLRDRAHLTLRGSAHVRVTPPYGLVRLAAKVLWQPLFSPSRERRRGKIHAGIGRTPFILRRTMKNQRKDNHFMPSGHK